MSPRPLSVFMIYLEPAPYIMALVEQIRSSGRVAVDVVYVAAAMSQRWLTGPQNPNDSVLPSGTWRALSGVRKRLAAKHYDILHLAGWGHPVLLGALAWGRARGIPVVVESDTQRAPGAYGWRQAVKRLVYPHLFTLPTVFMPGGAAQVSYLRDYGVSEKKMRTAMMTVDVTRIRQTVDSLGIDQRKAARKRVGMDGETVTFLFVGRLEPHKGLDDLLAAFGRLQRRQRDVALLIAGDGSMRERIDSAVSENASIHYLGRIEGDRLWETYAIADVFVLPSRFEPWGLVVNEAMAAGLPVVVSDRVGCVQDLVRDGESGIVIPHSSPESLALAMEAITPKEVRSRMAASGRAIIEPWTIENLTNRTIAAWEFVAA